MSELIDNVPGFERTEAENTQLEARQRAMAQKVISIENQGDVRINPDKAPGHPAYEEKQKEITSFILSNRS